MSPSLDGEPVPPVNHEFVWVWPHHLHAFLRSWIDSDGRCWVDGERVNVAMYQQFQQEWSAWYDASEAGADGHRCWALCTFGAISEYLAALATSGSSAP